jgi:hypothetical protein
MEDTINKSEDSLGIMDKYVKKYVEGYNINENSFVLSEAELKIEGLLA